MKRGSTTWWAPDGPALITWIGVLGGIAAIWPFVVDFWTHGHAWTATGVALLVVVPVLLLFWRLVLRLKNALALTLTWGEALHGGVRWGWNRGQVGRVLGPYCPDPAHGDRLQIRSTGKDAVDGDVVGPGNPLYCPQEPQRDYFFDDPSLSGVSVGAARERVRLALSTLGVWRRISA